MANGATATFPDKTGPARLRRAVLPRWTRLDAYIFSEIHYPFFIAMLLYNGLFFIRTFGEVSDLSGGMFAIPAPLFVIFFISRIPEILLATTPLAFALAALTALGRMSGDSEIIAPQSSGVGFWRMNRPVFAYGLMLTLILAALANFAGPAMNRYWQEQYYEFVDKTAVPNLNQGVINSLGKDSILYVKDVDQGRLANVFFVNKGKTTEEILLARFASIYTNRNLEVFDALHLNLDLAPAPGQKAVEIFQSVNSEQSMPVPRQIASRRLIGTEKDAMHSLALYFAIEADPANLDLQVELYTRLLSPLILLALALFATPLAAKHSRFRRGSGFVWSLLLIGAYFMMTKIARDAALQGRIEPLTALAAPLAVFVALGSVLQLGKNLWWGQWLARLQDRLATIAAQPGRGLKALLKRGPRNGKAKRGRDPSGKRAAQTFFFPSKLDIYITKSFLAIFAVVQCSLIMLMLLVEYSQLSKFIHRYDIGAETVLRLMLFKTPEIINVSMFSCMLIAALILFALMSKNQEVTAVRAGGGSLRRLCFPLLVCGALGSGLTYYMENSFLPKANRVAVSLTNTVKNRDNVLFSDDVWLKQSDNEILNYRYYDAPHQRLVGVRHYRFQPEGPDFLSWTDLPSLVYRADGWQAERPGKVWRFYDEAGDIKAAIGDVAPRSAFPLNLGLGDLSRKKRKASEFSIQELRDYLTYLSNLGYSENHYQTELYAKFARPLIPFVMMLLAAPLGFHFGRRGAFYGVGAGLVAGLVFLGLFEFLKSLGSSGAIHPVAAGWTAVVLFGFAAVYRFVNFE